MSNCNKQTQCSSCLTFMRSDNLKRHKCCGKSERDSSKIVQSILGPSCQEFSGQEPNLSLTISSPSQEQLSLVISECMKPISFGELWCNEGQKEDEEDEEDEDEDEEKDEDEEEKEDEGVKFLPTTREGLQKRFNELFYEFTRREMKRNRNELVFLLDEMLRKNFITPLEYQSLNNIIA